MRSYPHAVFLAALALLTPACAEQAADENRDAASAAEADPAMQPAPTERTAPARAGTATTPDTTAEALWAFLQDEAYRDGWALWPGKDELYSGAEPHGMLLTTYVNERAREALLEGGPASLPPGAIIVKENWTPDSTFAATTVMYKVDGYNPDHMDWLFAKYDTEGSPEAFGRAAGCQACHQQAESGYIYTPVQR